MAERAPARAGDRDRAPKAAPLRNRLLTIVLMGVPFVVALFLLVLALSTGMALALAFGWLAVQLVGYIFLIPRVGLYPLRPVLAAQIVIHWLGTAFVLYFLFGGGV